MTTELLRISLTLLALICCFCRFGFGAPTLNPKSYSNGVVSINQFKIVYFRSLDIALSSCCDAIKHDDQNEFFGIMMSRKFMKLYAEDIDFFGKA